MSGKVITMGQVQVWNKIYCMKLLKSWKVMAAGDGGWKIEAKKAGNNLKIFRFSKASATDSSRSRVPLFGLSLL